MRNGSPGNTPALAAIPELAADATLWVAFSGGLDSTVLLHLLRQSGRPLKALHINHHLQASANTWVEHCRALCAQSGVPMYVMDVKVDPQDPAGPEAAAREARYAAIRSLMRPGDVLATAHHLDDQAETVLLRLLRGAGVAGLAAMRPLADFPPGRLWRPLLPFSRPELRQYAERHNLPWVEDPHNLDPRYSRSFLRNEIFSRLAQRWPGAAEQLARTAEHCSEAVELLDELAAADLKPIVIPASHGDSLRSKAGIQFSGLSVRGLLNLAPARRNNALRYWIARSGFDAPPADTLRRVEREVLRARPDAAPLLAWGEAELRRFRDGLYAMPRLPPPPGEAVREWDGRSELKLPEGCGVLKVAHPARTELPLQVRFTGGGERLKPAGARYTRTLRNLFQEEAVPPWVRERMPLLYLDGDLVSVADRWDTAPFKALCRRERLQFSWQHALAGDDGQH